MPWICHGCDEVVDDFVLKCSRCGTVHPSAALRETEKPERDFAIERHLGAVAIWFKLAAIVGVAIALLFDPTFRFVALVSSVAAFVIGLQLARRSDHARGWAGIFLLLGAVATGVHLWVRFGIAPVALLACELVMMTALFHPRAGRACSGPYRAIFPGRVTPLRSPLLWLPLLPCALYLMDALRR